MQRSLADSVLTRHTEYVHAFVQVIGPAICSEKDVLCEVRTAVQPCGGRCVKANFAVRLSPYTITYRAVDASNNENFCRFAVHVLQNTTTVTKSFGVELEQDFGLVASNGVFGDVHVTQSVLQAESFNQVCACCVQCMARTSCFGYCWR